MFNNGLCSLARFRCCSRRIISKGVLLHVCLGLCFLTIWQLEVGDTTRFVVSARSLSPTTIGTGRRSLISSTRSTGPCSVSPSSATIARTRCHTALGRLRLRAVVREGGCSLRRRTPSSSLSRSSRSLGPSSIQIRTSSAARDGRLGLLLRFAGCSAATARPMVTIPLISANLRVWSAMASFATTLGPCPGSMSTGQIQASRRGFETGTGTRRVR